MKRLQKTVGRVLISGIVLTGAGCRTRVCDTPETQGKCFGEPMADASGRPDLSKLPDLSRFPDLKMPEPDLAKPPDMTQPPDLAPTCTPKKVCGAQNVNPGQSAAYMLMDFDSGKTYTQKVTVTNNMDGSTTYHAEFSDGMGSGIPTSVLTHKFQIYFLGKAHIITEMVKGEVTVSKEAVSGIVNVNEALVGPSCYDVKLIDVEYNNGINSGIFSIVTKTGVPVGNPIKIAEGVTYYSFINGITLPIRVSKVAPGYTFGKAKWAQIAILTEDAKLVSGQDISINGQPQKGFKATVKSDNAGNLLSFDVTIPKGGMLDYCSYE
ncbi:hypothetical protein HY988_06090 [Candidatus Micrarchaeota archaeon]|nr:hypothetical protein [Candidatus Micrarchaeota archaeon]